MKKLILLAVLITFACKSNAQTATLSLVTAPCDSNGIVVATFTGLTNPFFVEWTFPASPFVYYDTVTTGTTDTLFGFAGGNVSVYGQAIGTGTGSAFDSMYFIPPFTVSVTATAVTCPALSTLNATVAGGTGPFTYKWENAITYSVVGTGSSVSLPAGNYFIRVTDMSTGCVGGFLNGTIASAVSPDFTQTVTTTPAVCPVLGSASALVTSGGVTPFTYVWTNNAGSTIGTTSTISVPTGVGYNEVTTDALGCSVGSYDLVVTYAPDFTATVTTTNADCTNGTASVSITGGTAPFSYLWSNGATTNPITGLITGTYTLHLTDALGCVDSALEGFVPQTITITDADVVTPATCIAPNGSIMAFGSGGTPPYSYLWSNGATTQTITGLAGGYYYVRVTDANGCIGSGNDYVSTSTPITVSYATTPSACTAPTGSATLTIGGGTAPYTVTWYTTPPQTGTTATALSAGNYYFSIVDAAGCTQHGTVIVPPVDVIYLSFTSTPATCLASNGSVSVTATGGFTPYSYSWNTGGTTSSLSAIASGTYTATVTDAHGCSVSNCQHVPYTSPLVLGLSSTDASCLYTHDGTITATASLGTPPYIFSTGGSSSGSVTIPGLATGPYWIYVTDAIGCNTWEYTYVDYDVSDSSCFCVVKGTVYDDINHNCIQDAGEPGIQNIQLQASGFGYTYTNPSGEYYFLLPSGTYTVAQTVLHMYPLSPCQPNDIPYTSVAATGCNTTINFADTLNPIHDMHISTWDYTAPPRPGFPYTQVSVITNDGTVTEPNILAGYNPDGQIYGPSFVPSGIFSGAPYYYNTTGSSFTLTPGAGQQFLINYNVPADIPLGTNVIFKDSVAYTSPMTNWLSDYSPWNNINYFTTTTVGSYDPNFKEVSPKGWDGVGMITTDDSVLEYMVHFQNTGSYMAENVVVKDTLDANLNWASLKPVYMSDKCVVKMDDNGHVTFTFNNIDLPPSSSEPITSNAMFTYTVKLRPGLALGTQIKNRGSIYFDFNAPILTNQTLNTIGWPEHTPTVAAPASGNNTFTIYPNPAQNTFNAIINMDNSGNYSLTVCDVTGKTEISKKLSLQKGSQNITVDAGRLSPGVYFVTLKGDDNFTQTQKLVILK